MRVTERAAATPAERARVRTTADRRAGGLHALQRSAGNRAVAAMVAGLRTNRPVQRSLADELRACLTGGRAKSQAPVVQRDLAGDLRGQIDITGPPAISRIMSLINAAPANERQAVIADSALMKLIGTRLNRNIATTVASALLRGTRKWKNPTGNDFFRFFVMGTGSGPASPRATMNCWESIMYAAYLVGVVSDTWIRNFYTTAIAAGGDTTAVIFAQLGWSSALPTYNPAAGREPTAGQLVFYHSGGTYPGHVAISMGSGQVMSLWDQPHGVDSIQQIGITELSGTITFRDPPW